MRDCQGMFLKLIQKFFFCSSGEGRKSLLLSGNFAPPAIVALCPAGDPYMVLCFACIVPCTLRHTIVAVNGWPLLSFPVMCSVIVLPSSDRVTVESEVVPSAIFSWIVWFPLFPDMPNSRLPPVCFSV